MVGGLLVLFVCMVVAFVYIDTLYSNSKDRVFLKQLFGFHILLTIVYYIYALFNPSDSWAYFLNMTYTTRDWFAHYGTSTDFIEFLTYPLIHFLEFNYEACMALFGFTGFLGFFFFYGVFKDRIRFDHRILGVPIVSIIFFLPNLHFWSGSLGKGSVILMGIGAFFYGIINPGKRWIYILFGAIITYHVRPHIFLVIVISLVLGSVFTTKGLSVFYRAVLVLGAGVAFAYIYQDVFTLVGIETDQALQQGLDLSDRAGELTKATSGIDIENYNFAQKMFAFLYRPLFIDAPGALGLIVSVENLFYLALTVYFFAKGGLKFIFKADYFVKTAFFSFITVSIALAQISGNLGLAIRQKSQVMLLFMFVIISLFEEKKVATYKVWLRKRKMKLMKQPIN